MCPLHVNPSAKLLTPTAETPSAKSMERKESGSAESFFVQMDRVWNVDDKSVDLQPKKGSGEQPSTPSGNESRELSPGGSALSAKSMGAKSAASNTANPVSADGEVKEPGTRTASQAQIGNRDSHSLESHAAPGCAQSRDTIPALAGEELKGIRGAETAMVGSQSVMPGTSPGSRGSLPDPGSPSQPFQPALSGQSDSENSRPAHDSGISQPELLQSRMEVSSRSGSNTGVEVFDFANDCQLSGTINPQNASFRSTVFRIPAGMSSAAVEPQSTGDVVQHDSPMKSDPGSMQQNPGPAQTVSPDPRQELRSSLELDSVRKERTHAADPDANPLGEGPRAAAAGKLGNTPSASYENANPGDSNASQDASRSQSFSWTTVQSKMNGSQLDSSASPTFASERQHEVFSPSAAGSMRVTESGRPAPSGTEKAAASHPGEFIFQLAERILIQVRDGKSEMRIHLRPDGLGHLEIRAETTANGITARILAGSGSVKDYLESNLHVLQQNLQDQGLKINRIHIAVQDGTGSQSSAEYAPRFGNPGSENSGSNHQGYSEISGRITSGQAEEMTVDLTTWASFTSNSGFHAIA